MEAKEKLAKLAPKINKEIQKIIDKEYKHASKISPITGNLLKNIKPITAGGKRLRGAFLYYSYLMFGGKNKKEILKTTPFIELTHTYLLVHDDIMDNDDLRRGQQTLHKIYRDEHINKYKKGDAAHFGESIAICGGDILSHIALRVMVEADFPSEYKLRALQKFHNQILDTAYGQVLDVFSTVFDNVSENYALKVHLYKTAKYTYENPLFLGAILAGACDDDLMHLSQYAIPAGIAFQLQDDILGMFGDVEKIGKPADSDLKEGKQTPLLIYALKHATPKHKEFLLRALGNQKITKRTLETVKKIIINTGALDYTKNLAQKFVKEAKIVLQNNSVKWEKEGRKFLEDIADYMINREL